MSSDWDPQYETGGEGWVSVVGAGFSLGGFGVSVVGAGFS